MNVADKTTERGHSRISWKLRPKRQDSWEGRSDSKNKSTTPWLWQGYTRSNHWRRGSPPLFSVEGAQNKKHVTVNKFTLQRFESTDWSADWRQTPAVKLSALHFTWWNHFCYDPSCDKSSVNVKGVVVTKGKIVYLKSDLCCRYLLITMSQKCL